MAVAFGLVLGAMNLCIYEAMDRIPLGIAVTFEFIGPLGVAVGGLAAGARRAVGRAGGGGDPLLADYGGGSLDPPGSRSRSPRARCGPPTSCCPRAPARCSPAAAGWRSRWWPARRWWRRSGSPTPAAELLAPELLGAILAVALASSVLPYSLELEALRRLPPRVFGVLMSLEPAVAALAGFVVLDQGLAARDWLAIGLVVVASAGASTLEP